MTTSNTIRANWKQEVRNYFRGEAEALKVIMGLDKPTYSMIKLEINALKYERNNPEQNWD